MSQSFSHSSWIQQESRQNSNTPLMNFGDSTPTDSDVNSPLTPQQLPSNLLNLSDNLSNTTGVHQQQQQQQQEPSKLSYSMQDILDVYQQMSDSNSLIPVASTEPFRSSTLNSILHVDILNGSKQNQKAPVDTTKNDNVAIGLKNLSLDDTTTPSLLNNDLSSWAGTSNSIPASKLFRTEVQDFHQQDQPFQVQQQQQQQPLQHDQFGNGVRQLLSSTNSFSSPSVSLPTPAQAGTHSMPPGLNIPLNNQVTTVDPSQVEWQYLDPTGGLQGPFTSVMMQSWFNLKYFSLDLRVRRVGEHNYKTLGEFMQEINEYTLPFSISLPPISNNNENNNGNSTYASTTHTPGHVTPFSQSHPILQHTSSFQSFNSSSNLFGNDNSTSQFFNNTTTSFHQPQATSGTSSVPGTNNSTNNQGAAWPPVTSTNNDFLGSRLYTQSPFLPNNQDLNVQLNMQPFSIEQPGLSPTTTASPVVPASTAAIIEPTEAASEPVSIKGEPVRQEKKQENEKELGEEKNVEEPVPAPEVKTQPIEASKPKKSALAPWATATQTVKPAKTLQQIQQEEAEKREQELQLLKKQEEQDRKLAERLLLEEEEMYRVEVPENADYKINMANVKQAASLPSTSKWASTPRVSTKPVKTLADIQKEEAALASAKAKQAAAQAQAAANKLSFANAVSSPGSPWTVVGGKKVAKPVQPTGKVLSKPPPNGTLSPAQLRSVSASSTSPAPGITASNIATPVLSAANLQKKPTVSTGGFSSVSPSAVLSPNTAASTTTTFSTGTSMNSSLSTSSQLSPSKEFLGWCRSQLQQLNNGVNKEDVLSIMLQFPTGAAQEIIADTIYSNSSVLDGRRFASEFTKRKGKVEEIIKRQGLDFSWSEALNSSNSGDDGDDWDMAFTKVVNKKSKRRN